MMNHMMNLGQMFSILSVKEGMVVRRFDGYKFVGHKRAVYQTRVVKKVSHFGHLGCDGVEILFNDGVFVRYEPERVIEVLT